MKRKYFQVHISEGDYNLWAEVLKELNMKPSQRFSLLVRKDTRALKKETHTPEYVYFRLLDQFPAVENPMEIPIFTARVIAKMVPGILPKSEYRKIIDSLLLNGLIEEVFEGGKPDPEHYALRRL